MMANLCECGCGEEIAEDKRYVRGHHLRKSRPIDSIVKVNIYPMFRGEDKGEGGIRRVWEAQVKHLPKYGVELVDSPEEADVIAFHATLPETYTKLYPNKAFVSMCHGLYWSEYQWDNWSLKANADVMEGIRVSDAVISCSEWVANSIRRNTSRDTRVIYHGVDLEDWNGHDPLPYVLWNKTRPDPVCDPESFNQIVKAMPDIKFVSTFGDEAPNVEITGKLPYPDAKKLVERASVYLCTTRETFGIGTLEALACGVPIVGFDWGGQAEFIEHGVDGWLVKPGDIIGLTTGIRWALAKREHISKKCLEKAEKFSWDEAAKQYADVFITEALKKRQKNPRTSIIVTNYDLHKYLHYCLDSVVAQKDQDWECIIVDDASTDKTGIEIAEGYAKNDARFRVIKNEKNTYLAEARNIGIRHARGKYILPLDADDGLAPDAVQILADALDTDRSIHIAYGNVYFVNEDGVTPTNYGLRNKEPGFSTWPYQFRHEIQIDQKNLLPYCSMYRRPMWSQLGGYRRRCRTAEDADLWTRASSYGFRPKMVTEEITLIYRNREGSMSRTNSSDWIRWFTWSKVPEITPSGAVTDKQLPVLSVDPIVISVIIPVGPGHGKIVTDAIDSVDAQTFRNWECIVVNDTGQPLETELPSWVRVIETSGKVGPAAARNKGIAASRGRLFIPLDADDYLEPFALQMMYEAHQERVAEVVYCDFWQDARDGTIQWHHCDDYDPETLITGRKREFEGVFREGMIHSVTALIPKKRWEEVGGYDESIPGWEDWDFQIALADKNVCSRRVAFPLFMYRMKTGLRREENLNDFERSKEGITKKWGAYWEGKKTMPCGACKRGKTSTFNPSTGVMTLSGNRGPAGAKILNYDGNKAGQFSIRGKSGTVYWFSSTDPQKFVLEEDVPFFVNRGDFSVVEPKAEIDKPVLVAEGQTA